MLTRRAGSGAQARDAGYACALALQQLEATALLRRVDALAVSCLDRMEELEDWRVCTAYHYPGPAAELDGAFEHDGQLVSAIRLPADPTDLAQQEWLTHRLAAMQPVYETWPRSRSAYLAQLEAALGLPIAITSDGPTARDKQIRLPELAK